MGGPGRAGASEACLCPRNVVFESLLSKKSRSSCRAPGPVFARFVKELIEAGAAEAGGWAKCNDAVAELHLRMSCGSRGLLEEEDLACVASGIVSVGEGQGYEGA